MQNKVLGEKETEKQCQRGVKAGEWEHESKSIQNVKTGK